MQSTVRNLQIDKWESSGHLEEGYYKEQLSFAGYSDATIENYIYIYKQFKEKYPRISDWFEEDVQVRVSDNKERNLSYRSRIYILIMALNGLKLDYSYLFSLSGTDGFTHLVNRLSIDVGFDDLSREAQTLGYSKFSADTVMKWSLSRILLHEGKLHYSQLTAQDLSTFKQEAVKYAKSELAKIYFPDGGTYGGNGRNRLDRFTGSEYLVHACLYSLHVIDNEPVKEHARSRKLDRSMSYLKNQKIADTTTRYLKQCSGLKEHGTIENSFRAINKFALWLESKYPTISSYSDVTRAIVEDYMTNLKENGSDKFGKPYSRNAFIGYISPLKVFFDEALAWGYEDVPQRKILFDYDLPRRPKSLPRYIPEPDLSKLMDAVSELEDTYQRNAFILTRWTGARREEIQRLDINALDHYNDGTPRLRIPIGKTDRDRYVPINKEAEKAFIELLELRKTAGNTRGLIDRKTKKETDYLFMKGNRRISISYLFEQGLEAVCRKAGLLTTEGKPKYTAHQFRHTIGTTLANNGASLQTIMKVLGHESPEMSLVYSTIFDSTVKEEYENAILQNKDIAGGAFAISIKNQDLNQDEIDWIKANFHKTYLMTGHCFHHTKEPMCDFADACFFCAKYVASKDNIPVLLDKYRVEVQLINDAVERGWDKEVARHEKVAMRVKEILSDLGEDVDG